MDDERFSNALLGILDRFENQLASQSHSSLIELFCLQIIPFIEKQTIIAPLRESWSQKYISLLREADSCKKKALEEVTEVFSDLLEHLQNRQEIPIQEQITHIQELISGNSCTRFSSWPLYKTIYFEIKHLLELLAENGEEDLCKQFATLGVSQEAIVQKKGAPKIIEKSYVDVVANTSSFETASDASRAIHYDQLNNPAIVWWYFKSALWCWNTSEDYFNNIPLLSEKQNQNPIPSVSEKSTWREIAAVKKGENLEHSPVIFTDDFFQSGFKTLINEIYAYASNGFKLPEIEVNPLDKMIFELKLNENRLWVFVHTGLSEPKKYYIKRFNDGMKGGSNPHDFIKELLQNHPNGGDVEVPLIDKSDSIPKATGRLGLHGPLKNLFFGQSRGPHILFKGEMVALDRDEICHNMLDKLQEIHVKSGSPEYIDYSFSAS